MSSRRDLFIVAIVVIAAALAGYAWLCRPAPEPAPRIGVAPDDAPLAKEEGPSEQVVREEAARRERALEVRANKDARKAAQYRRRALFPPGSRPIEDGVDPIQGARIPEMERSSDPDDPGPTLITFPSVTTFEAPATVVIYAQVVEREERQQGQRGDLQELRVAPAKIVGVVRDPHGDAVAAVAFNDAGRNDDAEAGDLLFTASFTPDPDRPEDFRGPFRVTVTAETGDGEELAATTGFVYAVPSAHLTGKYRDAIVDGHLQIEAEVAVSAPGEFQLEGTLASSEAVMLGFAKNRVTLDQGTAWIPLTFWGLILREHDVDGPYNLFSVTLTTLSDQGAQGSDVVGNAHNTAAYRVTDFTDLPYNDPDLLEKAARLEAAPRRAPAN